MEYTLKDGVIDFVVAGEAYQLVATVKSAMAVDKAFGGMGDAAFAVQRMSLNGIFTIIDCGLTIELDDDLREKLFAESIDTLSKIATEFLMLLQNGGKKTVGKEAGVETRGKGKR